MENAFTLFTDDLEEGTRTNHSIFSIEYYQKFFDVDATIVFERIMSAIVPRRAPVHYMKQDIGPNPDLYGPFWIVVTLVNTLFGCSTSDVLYSQDFIEIFYIIAGLFHRN